MVIWVVNGWSVNVAYIVKDLKSLDPDGHYGGLGIPSKRDIMTKKDYIAIAKVINHVQRANIAGDISTKNVAQNIAYGIADVMQSDNPNFDRNRFLLACGVTPG